MSGTNNVIADLCDGLKVVGASDLLRSGDRDDKLVEFVGRFPLGMVDVLDALDSALPDVRIDEKEGYVRLHVATCDGFDVRLHVWLPVHDEEYVENVHNHRRYMVSRLLCGSYRSYEFSLDPADTAAVRLDHVHTVSDGDTRLIGPDTIHAIGNPFARHCVSLIVRGEAVTSQLRTFDRATGTVGRFESQKPVLWTGRAAADRHLGLEEYKEELVARLRAEALQP